MSGAWELCAGLGCPNIASSSGPLCRKCHKAELAKGGYRPPAAGPWHKWPEEKPKDWTRCIVEHTYNDGEPFYCVEVIGESTPFVKLIRWAEILPPSEP